MISPFKGAIGGAYKTVERGLQAAIHIRFGLPAGLPDGIIAAIKRADKVAAFSEAVDLAGFTEAEARKILGYRRKLRTAPLESMSPKEAKRTFLPRFAELAPPRSRHPPSDPSHRPTDPGTNNP